MPGFLQRSVTDVLVRPASENDKKAPRRRKSLPLAEQLPIEARRRRDEVPAHNKEKLPDRYKAQQAIGKGSYGCVWEAFDQEESRLVAVKRVSNLFRDAVDCKRILREISLMSKLSHPGIVRLYDMPPVADVGSFDEMFIIMELCDADMQKLVRTNVTLSPGHVTTLLYNLLVGLKYLHSAGIYHRDLKPANCLVNKDCSVKICDFGLSRAVGERHPAHLSVDEDGQPRLKRALTNHVATRWYRAPELILLQEDYTEAVDVWSVGCIYAELLAMLEGGKLEDRCPLFPGSSCFPLSPDKAHATDYLFHTRENHDQLNVIFNYLGTPTEEDFAFLQREDAKRYLDCFRPRQGHGLQERFFHAGPDAIDVLEDALWFNPQKRSTVNGLLDHPIFDGVRNPDREIEAPGPICLDFETGPDLDELRLRANFMKVMASFRTSGRTGGA
mmetsp:Transcript_5272/g.11940  ORF Transcript_5272/g.11940 Transcript_5272/m.11940 type:complete len:443 (+) Transcript_5272:68-1396(+)